MRFELHLVVSDQGQGQVEVGVVAPDVAGLEVARHLMQAALQFMTPNRMPTRAEVLEVQRRAQITKDYPGVKYHPGSKAFLCPACVDLVADAGLLEGEVIDTPVVNGSPIPGCTYHLANTWPGGLTLDQLSERRAAQTPEEDA